MPELVDATSTDAPHFSDDAHAMKNPAERRARTFETRGRAAVRKQLLHAVRVSSLALLFAQTWGCGSGSPSGAATNATQPPLTPVGQAGARASAGSFAGSARSGAAGLRAAGAPAGTYAAGTSSSVGLGGAAAAAGAGAGTTAAAGGGASGAGAGALSAANAGAGAGAAGAPSSGAGSSATGAGADAVAPSSGGCAAAGLLFCDDFETGTTPGMPPPAPSWQVQLNGMGSVAIDGTTAAHSGTKSVHVSSAGGYQTFFVLEGAPVFPASAALYLRLYLRLAAPMTPGHNTYYKVGAASAPSSEHETRIGVMNAMLMINQPAGDRGFLSNQNYYNDGNKPGVVFQPMTWTCIEAYFDPAHSTFDIWVDGKEVPDLHRTDWQQDPLGSFHFGFEKYAGPDAELWYDDIAVSTQPIGCL